MGFAQISPQIQIKLNQAMVGKKSFIPLNWWLEMFCRKNFVLFLFENCYIPSNTIKTVKAFIKPLCFVALSTYSVMGGQDILWEGS